MKRLLLILILTLSVQTLSKADDISDFEIEGMSIGDSALDYFSKSTLRENKNLEWYDTKIFTPIAELKLNNSKIYESFQIAVKTNDKNYKIESIAGFVFYKNNISECYNKLDSIAQEVKSLFNNIKDLGKDTYKHSYDKTGKSKITDIVLQDDKGNEIAIQCYDWSSHLPYWDQLRITIDSKEYAQWVKVAYD